MIALIHVGPSFVPACIGALGAICAAILGLVNRKTANEIRINVNHRLDQALDEIGNLKEALGRAQSSPADDSS